MPRPRYPRWRLASVASGQDYWTDARTVRARVRRLTDPGGRRCWDAVMVHADGHPVPAGQVFYALREAKRWAEVSVARGGPAAT